MNVGIIIGIVIGAILLIAAYWLPSMVANSRKVPNVGSIVIINLFAGWTLIGWVVAMAMAVRDVSAPSAAQPANSLDGYR